MLERPTLLYILPFLHFGVGRLVADLIQSVVAGGTICRVVTCGHAGHLGDDPRLVDELREIDVALAHADVFSRDPDRVRAARLAVGEICDAADVALAHSFTAMATAAALPHVPVVASAVGWAPEKPRWQRAMDASILEQSQKLTAVSEAVAHELVEAGLKRDAIEIIRNGVDVSAHATDRSVCAGHPVIGVMAQLTTRKGVDVFLDALAQALLAHAGRAIVAGTGDCADDLRRQAARLGLASRVDFVGHVDVDAFLDHVDVVVVPSRSDALPIVLLQTMAAQRPVVATRVGGIPEAVHHEVHGLLVEPDDPSAMAQAIADVIRRPAAARTRARQGRHHVEAKFSRSATTLAYRSCYSQVLEASPRPGRAARRAIAS